MSIGFFNNILETLFLEVLDFILINKFRGEYFKADNDLYFQLNSNFFRKSLIA